MLAGAAEGALITQPDGTQDAILFSSTAEPASGGVSFVVPAAATYCLLPDLVPGTGYSVQASLAGGQLTVTISPGGAWMTSAEGSLAFDLSAIGAVTMP